MTPAGLATRALELLGPVTGRVVIACPASPGLAAALTGRVRPARDGDAPVGAVVAFLGAATGPAERQALLRSLQDRLAAGAPLVLLDHNQPRALWRRGLGVFGLAVRGLTPARARYPAARELAALGFTVQRLRLMHGERVQLVLARSP